MKNFSLPSWKRSTTASVGEFAVDLDALFTRKRVAGGVIVRARVTEDLAGEVGQEIGQDFGFVEPAGLAGGEHRGPFRDQLPAFGDARWQLECRQVRTEDVRAEEGFDFDGQRGAPGGSLVG